MRLLLIIPYMPNTPIAHTEVGSDNSLTRFSDAREQFMTDLRPFLQPILDNPEAYLPGPDGMRKK